MDEVDQSCDDELIIVNRRCEYCVSKKFICSVVPYFAKLFAHNELKSRENKVTLDFDERAFDALLDWIHTGLFIIQMDYVISFYEAADDLKIDDRLWEPCIDYFYDNFTIEHLPVVLRQVTQKSLLINSGDVNSFICRHFLKIANTVTFLEYPVETLEHILKLDLMVYSEHQVFESIMKWVNKNVDARKEFISSLLRCVRWSFINFGELSKVKDNELIKTLRNFDSIVSSNDDCEFNRTKQNYFVAIQELLNARLRISIFDKDLFCLPIGDFTVDRTMSLGFFHDEDISDILFDAGRSGIRIDWDKKTYKWIEAGVNELYYSEVYKSIVNFQDNPSQYSCYLDARVAALPDTIPKNSYLLHEYNDGFVCIGQTSQKNKYFGIFPVTDSSQFNGFAMGFDLGSHVTILDNTLYVLTEEFNFFQFNMETRSYNKIELFKGAKDLCINELILTSHHTEDDKIIVIDKLKGKFYIYYINQKKWFQKDQLLNVNHNSQQPYIAYHKLIAFTSTFLSIKIIKPLFTRKFL